MLFLTCRPGWFLHHCSFTNRLLYYHLCSSSSFFHALTSLLFIFVIIFFILISICQNVKVRLYNKVSLLTICITFVLVFINVD